MRKAVLRAFAGSLLLAFGVLGIVSIGQAEAAKLKLITEIPKAGKANGKAYPREYYFRGRTQTFDSRISAQRKKVDPDEDPSLKEFNDLVKKEPTYLTKQPLKGVVEFGGKRYAFAMDAVPEKEEEDEADTEKKSDDEKKQDALTAEPKPNPLMNRLYLDRNGNGDLTDEEPIESEHSTNTYRMAQSQFTFTLPVENDSTKTDIPCRFDVTSNTSHRRVTGPDGKATAVTFQRCYVSFSTNCFREGEIKLGDKTFRVILLDYNNNGTFNDQYEKGYTYDRKEMGDLAYIFPADLENPRFTSTPFFAREELVTPTYLGSAIGTFNGQYWNLKLTPSGDRLTVTPFDGILGNVEKAGQPFSLRVFEKKSKSLLCVNSNQDGKAALPPGEWELLSYTMNFEKEKPKPVVDEETAKEAEADNDKKEDTKNPGVTKGNVTCILIGKPNATLKVTAKETAELQFGPPYKVGIRSSVRSNKGKPVARLSLSVTGSQGESCADVQIDGKRPAKPTFVITTKDGKEVESGAFEYG